ncbi:uncharacterized protein BDR25DRAFT_360231 [Lindgomyces ingoldianus]|uniref:Uncharacterized protein n=1 Tax=Lindgomyces ingoldianus TaxID=673940 RepID=A0ACB6QHT9_9PLEO|nr:uncharacterized protein BDR25DRAFT_360231 [Lindgomyces ingoldianus]KAF2465711.1 hypothetical protein BDR25DRAFT_360231 [Lindgomyces ingoldianus]
MQDRGRGAYIPRAKPKGTQGLDSCNITVSLAVLDLNLIGALCTIYDLNLQSYTRHVLKSNSRIYGAFARHPVDSKFTPISLFTLLSPVSSLHLRVSTFSDLNSYLVNRNSCLPIQDLEFANKANIGGISLDLGAPFQIISMLSGADLRSNGYCGSDFSTTAFMTFPRFQRDKISAQWIKDTFISNPIYRRKFRIRNSQQRPQSSLRKSSSARSRFLHLLASSKRSTKPTYMRFPQSWKLRKSLTGNGENFTADTGISFFTVLFEPEGVNFPSIRVHIRTLITQIVATMVTNILPPNRHPNPHPQLPTRCAVMQNASVRNIPTNPIQNVNENDLPAIRVYATASGWERRRGNGAIEGS